MDLVKIGFLVKADGLEKANREVDALLAKMDQLGKKPPVSIPEPKTPKGGGNGGGKGGGNGGGKGGGNGGGKGGVDAVTKAMEKQVLVAKGLNSGLDKGTATSIAQFQLLGASVDQVNTQLNQLQNNKAVLQQRKDTELLTKEQQKYQEQQAKLVQDTVTHYEKLSNKSLGGGILDSIEQQNKGIEELRKKYQAEAKEANEKAESVIKAQEK